MGISCCNIILDIANEKLGLVILMNIYGMANTLREEIPSIIEARGGSIVVNVSDQWFVGKEHSFTYGMTNGAPGPITCCLALAQG